jgi:hypothetical protein
MGTTSTDDKKSVPAWLDRPVAGARFGAAAVLAKRKWQRARCLAAGYASRIVDS